jgi:hypothetical protein
VRKTTVAVAVVAVAAAFAAVAFAATNSKGSSENMTMDHTGMATNGQATAFGKASDLRVKLDRLFGAHVTLAVNATRRGLAGESDFAASAAALDRNSLQLANTIGSVYGKKARNQFLNGAFMWRAHIKFFVDYTVGLAKNDPAMRNKAVANLKTYIQRFGGFLATATGLPASVVRQDLTVHVGELKGQIDAYSKKKYALAYAIEQDAYAHMFMTGDAIAGAIVKQKHLR